MTKRKPSVWNEHLMKVYKELKSKDSSVKLKDAMKIAKESYKKEKTTLKGGI